MLGAESFGRSAGRRRNPVARATYLKKVSGKPLVADSRCGYVLVEFESQ